MITHLNRAQDLFNLTRVVDFLGPLALRLYLVPIFWMAGSNKIDFRTLLPNDGVVQWFAGLGLPFPALNAFLAGWTEVLGAVFLLLGFAVRWISIPLMITMVVAAATVHWQNGWLAIAEGSGFFATERTMGAIERLGAAKSILREHGNYNWLTENGSFVVLNNGIEFAATYFIMLLVLFFAGGGRIASLDYWVAKKFRS
ncbi:MAG: DoxX family protein [Gammaproteobacteria bacterium]|nr:DoxX family protein [Gammaproteobacteria bacterium]